MGEKKAALMAALRDHYLVDVKAVKSVVPKVE